MIAVRSVISGAAAGLVLAAVVFPAAADARLRPAKASGPLRTERLSNERTLSRWAHPYTTAKVRHRPSVRSRSFTRLHYHTEDGPLEVYLALRAVRRDGRTWIQVRVPGRPNGRKGWVPQTALGPLVIVRTSLRVDRSALRATLFRRGRKIWESPIGVGAPSTPTPAGRFWIREKLRSLGGIYGPWAFGTAAYSSLSEWPGGGVVGIHGTNQPELIPGRPSHGCIRVPNPKIIQLERRMPIGTPVRIV